MAERLFSGFQNDRDIRLATLRSAILSVDWESTPAGSIAGWPEGIRSTIRTALHAASPMAVLIGRDGIVVCNDAAQEMFGDAFDTAQGKPIFEVLSIAKEFYRKAIDESYLGRGTRYRGEPIKLLREGVWQTCWFNLGLSPIVGDNGEVHGTLLASSETSDHMRTRKALHLAHERMETALDAGGIVGIWDFDAARRKVMIDGSLAKQYGIVELEARNGVPIELLFENIHADDRQRVLAAVDQAMSSGTPFRSRFRTITQDGQLLWYIASGRPVRDDHEHVTGLAGIVIDITNQTTAADELEKSNLRFATLVETIPQIVWSADPEGNHDYFNSRWTEFTGIDHEDIGPQSWTGLVHPDDWERVSETWRHCLSSGDAYDIDYRFRYRDGTFRWLRVIAQPMRDAEGQVARWYGTSTDIDDAKQLETQRELVTRELDHRIKNLFALVNGLVGLSTREEPLLGPLAERLRSRLAALHKAHDIIRSNTNKKANSFKNLLSELLAPYLSHENDIANILGDDLGVNSNAVTSIALIFHELATNAAKYGALAHPDGRLNVLLERAGEWLMIRWTECFDVAPSDAATAPGFGSKLLETVVEKQFGGEIIRDRTEGGLSITLRLPISLFNEKSE